MEPLETSCSRPTISATSMETTSSSMPSCSSLVVSFSSEYVYMSDYSSQEYCYDAQIVSGNGVVSCNTDMCDSHLLYDIG